MSVLAKRGQENESDPSTDDPRDPGADSASTAAFVRSVVARMTTPLLPDDYLHMVNPLWSARELRGKVIEVVPETSDAATLVIKPGWGWNLSYQAGQYVGIGVHLDGKWHWRSYSISSSPADGNSRRRRGLLTITVKAMPEGFLSEHLVRGLEPGTIVRLALPQGEFVLPDPPPAKILFWTGGSGITPVMSMLRTLDRRDTMPDVVHIHCAPTMKGAIFREERLALAARHARLQLIENFDDQHGMFDVERLAEVCPDWKTRDAWICGPAPMLAAAEEQWDHAKLTRRLHLERFSAVLTTSAQGGRVTFSTSGKTAEVDGATDPARSRRGRRYPDAVRMSHGHLPYMHRPVEKGHGQGPTKRRGISRERRRADLRHGGRRRLRT